MSGSYTDDTSAGERGAFQLRPRQDPGEGSEPKKESVEDDTVNPKNQRLASGSGNGPTDRRSATGYMPIEDYGLIGNLRTCAMVATDGGLDYMCWPNFDSPSVFCRILDKDKGGHFTIHPNHEDLCTTKQHYLPGSNVLQTRYLQEEGVMNVVDFLPRPNDKSMDAQYHTQVLASKHTGEVPERTDLRKWLVRRVECMRGEIDVNVEVRPAFNYAQDEHTTEILNYGAQGEHDQRVVFKSKNLSLQLNTTIDCGEDDTACPRIVFVKTPGSELGSAVTTNFRLSEGQAVSFILRDADDHTPDHIDTDLVDKLQMDTVKFWNRWIGASKYNGRWDGVVNRSLLILKMLIFEPTGAIIAAPTFSLPEDFGGTRQWDYRFSWVRDSSFTIYIFLRMGYSYEAEAYSGFMFQRIDEAKERKMNGLPIMFTIKGETDIPEIELGHLEGYRASKPVRIGNGAAFHVQLDIYGELMDGIYLLNRFGKPVTYDQWLRVREIADYVCGVWKETDMSIWEVRGQKQNFVYSKIQMWVAIDRALRLADKRGFPCPHRQEWYKVRDEICEEVMDKGYNKELECFIQSYEADDVLDSAVLIAPLVFFIAPTDPRFLKTLDRILKAPEKGGLTSTGLVYRYNTLKSDDGVGGREGAFSMCTFWLVEALTRAGAYDDKYLRKAVDIFENMLSFGNHLHIFSEEIARSGEQLGNTPQAFSHLALISAAFNLDKTLATQHRR
ncbi:glycosyl hydrolase [Boeremia exigua]|uniref:glycosyl hydrolase n=1 Tax=Boeremia exigua TaxID=749465 RepID=UPI001E8CEC13|nr:glycosyl hydrolase [Boeremia exigua]KAH6644065.1 glycosyl hydrolase [Boeremia exigua]